MNYKHACVIDADRRYVTLVLVLMESKEDGTEQPVVQHYTLKAGESLAETAPPTYRPHAGAAGIVSPRWDGTAWAEAATSGEIAAWEAAHPAPAPAPPTAEEINAAAIAEAQALIGEQIEANIDLDYRLSMMELGLI